MLNARAHVTVVTINSTRRSIQHDDQFNTINAIQHDRRDLRRLISRGIAAEAGRLREVKNEASRALGARVINTAALKALATNGIRMTCSPFLNSN